MVQGYKDPDALERLYVEEGWTMVEIAEKYDVSYPTISRYLKKHDIISGDMRRGDYDVEEIRYLYEDCLKSQVEIAEELGISKTTVNRVVHREEMEQCETDTVTSYIGPRGYHHIAVKRPAEGGSETIATMYLHRLVAAWAHGMELLSDDIVHHKNECKMDNCQSNLGVLTHQEHNSIHRNAISD